MRIPAQSEEAKEVKLLLSGLQVYFVSKLNALALKFGKGKSCRSVIWECDNGKHGGGKRYEARDGSLFNQASVNVFQVHYEEVKHKAFDSSTVLSATIHPHNPHLPSLHLYISWEQMKEEQGSWHLIADLDPSILNESNLDKNIFSATVKKAVGKLYEEGTAEGDSYFNIPVLGRQRGVSHYYLKEYHSGKFEEDKALMHGAAESVINSYLEILTAKLSEYPTFTEEKKEEQLAYHTLYLFQILTHDRNTVKHLLDHDQDDLGILSALPSAINRDILSLWVEKLPAPKDLLLKQILKVLPNAVPTPVDDKTKRVLANTMRKHYKKHPEALSVLAVSETVIPAEDE